MYVRSRVEASTRGRVMYHITPVPGGETVGTVLAYSNGMLEYFDVGGNATTEQQAWLVAVTEWRKANLGIWP